MKVERVSVTFEWHYRGTYACHRRREDGHEAPKGVGDYWRLVIGMPSRGFAFCAACAADMFELSVPRLSPVELAELDRVHDEYVAQIGTDIPGGDALCRWERKRRFEKGEMSEKEMLAYAMDRIIELEAKAVVT
jgi:hypothetical protein